MIRQSRKSRFHHFNILCDDDTRNGQIKSRTVSQSFPVTFNVAPVRFHAYVTYEFALDVLVSEQQFKELWLGLDHEVLGLGAVVSLAIEELHKSLIAD